MRLPYATYNEISSSQRLFHCTVGCPQNLQFFVLLSSHFGIDIVLIYFAFNDLFLFSIAES